MAIVARTINDKFDSSNSAAHALKQEGCTDLAEHGVSSWCTKMTGSWSSTKGEENVHQC